MLSQYNLRTWKKKGVKLETVRHAGVGMGFFCVALESTEFSSDSLRTFKYERKVTENTGLWRSQLLISCLNIMKQKVIYPCKKCAETGYESVES